VNEADAAAVADMQRLQLYLTVRVSSRDVRETENRFGFGFKNQTIPKI